MKRKEPILIELIAHYIIACRTMSWVDPTTETGFEMDFNEFKTIKRQELREELNRQGLGLKPSDINLNKLLENDKSNLAWAVDYIKFTRHRGLLSHLFHEPLIAELSYQLSPLRNKNGVDLIVDGVREGQKDIETRLKNFKKRVSNDNKQEQHYQGKMQLLAEDFPFRPNLKFITLILIFAALVYVLELKADFNGLRYGLLAAVTAVFLDLVLCCCMERFSKSNLSLSALPEPLQGDLVKAIKTANPRLFPEIIQKKYVEKPRVIKTNIEYKPYEPVPKLTSSTQRFEKTVELETKSPEIKAKPPKVKTRSPQPNLSAWIGETPCQITVTWTTKKYGQLNVSAKIYQGSLYFSSSFPPAGFISQAGSMHGGIDPACSRDFVLFPKSLIEDNKVGDKELMDRFSSVAQLAEVVGPINKTGLVQVNSDPDFPGAAYKLKITREKWRAGVFAIATAGAVCTSHHPHCDNLDRTSGRKDDFRLLEVGPFKITH